MTARPGLLGGLRIARRDDDAATTIAVALLTLLGARPAGGRRADVLLGGGPPSRPGRHVSVADVGWRRGTPGLPPGALDAGVGYALAAGAVLCALGRGPVEVSRRAVLAQLYLPAVMAASYGSPRPAPACASPRPVGAGAVAADLGAPGDAERFETMLAALDPAQRSDPEAVARAAQLWRLPVLPCRRRGDVRAADLGTVRVAHAQARPRGVAAGDHADRRSNVVDLTSMWSGPLATWLLASSGADVAKVEPAVRPDGMRALDGRGVYAPGADPAGGDAGALFHALNRNKRRLDLDLREPWQRALLEAELAGADLVVENFSPRVMGNLALDYAAVASIAPAITLVSIPAFDPCGVARDWVAYGSGVHAACGLADTGDGAFAAPAYAYPDALAGLFAFAVATAVLHGRETGRWAGGQIVVPMSAALHPLLDRPPVRPSGSAAEDAMQVGVDLAADSWLTAWGGFVDVADPTGVHRHLRPPLRAAGLPVADLAAPAARLGDLQRRPAARP